MGGSDVDEMEGETAGRKVLTVLIASEWWQDQSQSGEERKLKMSEVKKKGLKFNFLITWSCGLWEIQTSCRLVDTNRYTRLTHLVEALTAAPGHPQKTAASLTPLSTVMSGSAHLHRLQPPGSRPFNPTLRTPSATGNSPALPLSFLCIHMLPSFKLNSSTDDGLA